VDPRLVEKQGKDTVEITFYIQPDEPGAVKAVVDTIAIADTINASHLVSTPKDNIMPEKPSQSSFYDIYFARSKAIFLPKSDNALFALTDQMKQNPMLEIKIIGHTDNIGDGEALVVLSNQRAEAVKMFLVRNGIDAMRIQTFGMGAADPLYENTTEANRERNRRVEIKVLKQ
jgi:outer membrane protein OmpA-like peptidoglycan-associated protein